MSGETPQEPVVSKKSGHVFEKRLITKWLETPSNNGLCPVTHEPLSQDDLIEVKGVYTNTDDINHYSTFNANSTHVSMAVATSTYLI